MTCPFCDKPYPCVHSRGRRDVSEANAVSETDAALRVESEPRRLSSSATDARSRSDHELWRQEVAMRVRRHRARRGRYDPSASLDLDFSSEAALAVAPDLLAPTVERDLPAPEFSAVLDPVAPEPEEVAPDEAVSGADRRAASESMAETVAAEIPARRPRKVIRFPRVTPVIVERPRIEEPELAEPAPEAPRILEAPEPESQQMDLLPSYADIRLEEAAPAINLCEELEAAPQPAALTRRFASGLVDVGIVLFAAGLFAAIFVQIVEETPSGRFALLYAVAAVAVLWLMFQYVFLVYGAATPGMRATKLELLRFNGRRPARWSRRVRALATVLSAGSVGLGFAWALVDEDALGWHDRISQTYVKSSSQHSAFSIQPK